MKQYFILFLISNYFNRSKAAEEFCPALDLVCKSQVIEKNTDKVIRRWLDKIRVSPLCFIGDQSETIHHEADNTFEVVRVSNGLLDGVVQEVTKVLLDLGVLRKHIDDILEKSRTNVSSAVLHAFILVH